MKISMSDILKPGSVLKSFKLSGKEVKGILNEVEIKQAKVRKLKEIRPGELDKIINI